MNIFRWILGTEEDPQRGHLEPVTCSELAERAQEYQIRLLAFNTAVNMISTYVSQCEIRTYRKGKEVKEREYYRWNIEPNVNQNKTAFFNKLVYQLMLNNEALIIETGSGEDSGLVVADSFSIPQKYPVKQNVYQNVTVDDFTYQKTFKEKEVIHIKLHNDDVKAVVDLLYSSYYDLVTAAMDNFKWNAGQHWKVHVDQIAQGGEDFMQAFSDMIEKQVKPFLKAGNAVLPEFDGYTYSDTSESRTTRSSTGETADIRNLINDIFDFTAQAFGIPAVLLKGEVENTEGAEARFYTMCDGIINQLSEEITRKRYGYEGWYAGSYIVIDSSAVLHFDMFNSAAKVEKLVGSGAFSINEVRKAAGQPVISEPWANEHFMTKNIAGLMAAVGEEGGTG